jgi:GT2 family glycosyltransferase
MKVSLLFVLYSPDNVILQKILKAIENQDKKIEIELIFINKLISKTTENILKEFENKHESKNTNIEVKWIKVPSGMGYARSMNLAIRKAKSPIIVSLHQDCLPSSNSWLKQLIEPLKDKDTVTTVSKVHLTFDFWKDFDPIAKILSAKEQKIITPAMDIKGCAYKKSVLMKVGLLDEKHYRTAGEDVDLYLKLKESGKIAYPNIKVIHYHKHTWKNRFKKELQLSNSQGALCRLHPKDIKQKYIGFLKAIPLLGFLLFLYYIDIKKLGIFLSLLAIPVYFFVNLTYSYGFWKGFLRGKQTV